MRDELIGFPIVIEIPVQWGDMDAFEHVNNVVFFRWWESSRLACCQEIGLMRLAEKQDVGTVLVSVTCDFRQQLRFPDRVTVGARIERVGNSSIGVSHRLVSDKTTGIVAEATSTVVTFDFPKQQTIRVPDEIREGIRRLQPDYEIPGLD